MSKPNLAEAAMNRMMSAATSAQPREVPINLIDIKPQDRTEFEDDENKLADLAESIKVRGVMQPVLLRSRPGGRYDLVAGERRVRACKLAGIATIPCVIKTLTDEEVEEAQFFENTQRKNLTNMEEARRLKKWLDRLNGDRAALQAKVKKPATWISNRLNLLDLPPQAARLLTESISSDLSTIASVRTLEKRDPEAAKELVDRAAAAPGKSTLRKDTEAANKAVKAAKGGKVHQIPGKPPGPGKPTGPQPSTATPRDRSQEEPSEATVSDIFAAAPQKPHEKVITAFVYDSRKPGAEVGKLLAAVAKPDMDIITKHGDVFFQKGKTTAELAQALMDGLDKNEFDKSPVGKFNLAAFLQGQAGSTQFEAGAALSAISSSTLKK